MWTLKAARVSPETFKFLFPQHAISSGNVALRPKEETWSKSAAKIAGESTLHQLLHGFKLTFTHNVCQFNERRQLGDRRRHKNTLTVTRHRSSSHSWDAELCWCVSSSCLRELKSCFGVSWLPTLQRSVWHWDVIRLLKRFINQSSISTAGRAFEQNNAPKQALKKKKKTPGRENNSLLWSDKQLAVKDRRILWSPADRADQLLHDRSSHLQLDQ